MMNFRNNSVSGTLGEMMMDTVQNRQWYAGGEVRYVCGESCGRLKVMVYISIIFSRCLHHMAFAILLLLLLDRPVTSTLYLAWLRLSKTPSGVSCHFFSPWGSSQQRDQATSLAWQADSLQLNFTRNTNVIIHLCKIAIFIYLFKIVLIFI